MSAPDTDLQKQRRRHRGPLIGIALVLIVVALGFVWWLGEEVAQAPEQPVPQTELAPPVATEPEIETLPPE